MDRSAARSGDRPGRRCAYEPAQLHRRPGDPRPGGGCSVAIPRCRRRLDGVASGHRRAAARVRRHVGAEGTPRRKRDLQHHQRRPLPQHVWPDLAEAFDLPSGPPQPMILAEELTGYGHTWDAAVARHGLQPTPYEQAASWPFADAVWGSAFDMVQSTVKIRQAGFHDAVDSHDCLVENITRMRAARSASGRPRVSSCTYWLVQSAHGFPRAPDHRGG